MIQVATPAPAAFGAPANQPLDEENTPASYTPPPRQAMPRKQALWKAVQHVINDNWIPVPSIILASALHHPKLLSEHRELTAQSFLGHGIS